ncbi:MAG: CPBP family intramembrane metalloprotease, partial [Clostridia bacterium]|nr:CPBP family intramembrane metalloprotease [Clostridia bacterium]
LAAPAVVASVMLLARASAALGEAAGVRETATLVGPLWQRVLVYALLPAVCEEALFRGLFPSFLSPIGRRGSLVCCSILFALMHASPLRWPYALAAGLLLGTVAEAAASPLPGMILHFFNNLLALCLIGRSDAAYISLCAVLVALAVVIRRLLPLAKRRDRIDAIRRVWRDDGATGRMMLELVRFPCVIVVALFVWAGVLSFF